MFPFTAAHHLVPVAGILRLSVVTLSSQRQHSSRPPTSLHPRGSRDSIPATADPHGRPPQRDSPGLGGLLLTAAALPSRQPSPQQPLLTAAVPSAASPHGSLPSRQLFCCGGPNGSSPQGEGPVIGDLVLTATAPSRPPSPPFAAVFPSRLLSWQPLAAASPRGARPVGDILLSAVAIFSSR